MGADELWAKLGNVLRYAETWQESDDENLSAVGDDIVSLLLEAQETITSAKRSGKLK